MAVRVHRRGAHAPRGGVFLAVALLTGAALAAGLPAAARACACGCGVFEVGTASMFPVAPGAAISLHYDFLDQSRNWSGRSEAPAAGNDDKLIRTHFLTGALQYTPNRQWSLRAEVPFWDRTFHTTAEDGSPASFQHSSLGDVRLQATYLGLSEDLSAGLSAGLKLPTGDDSYPGFDRDTEIGSGSTDLLLGAYHMAAISGDGAWNWFAQATWEQPFATHGGYRPGSEGDAALGLYRAARPGATVRISPVLQLIASARGRDSGSEASPDDTGYSRLLIAPGAELKVSRLTVYADLELPIYQWVNGNQLVSPQLLKVVLGYFR